MSTAPRTRTRSAVREETQETRSTGKPVAETVTTEHAKAGGVQVFQLPTGGLLARVTVKDGVTLNMGNYNSFRREVGLELDIPLDAVEVLQPDGNLTQEAVDRLDTTYQSVQDFVSDVVAEAVADAREYFRGLD